MEKKEFQTMLVELLKELNTLKAKNEDQKNFIEVFKASHFSETDQHHSIIHNSLVENTKFTPFNQKTLGIRLDDDDWEQIGLRLDDDWFKKIK